MSTDHEIIAAVAGDRGISSEQCDRLADELIALGFRRQGPVTDEEVRVAVKAYKAPRLHVNDSQIDREIDMRAALEALR